MAESRPIGLYEWQRLVRRIRMPWKVKSLALLLATYADPDGTRVRPGLDALAAVMETSERTVRRQMATLRDDYGLLLRVSRGGGRGGHGRTTDYRLAIPVDLLERMELLPPRERLDDSPAVQMSGQSMDSPDSQMSGENGSHPVDNVESPATQVAYENNFHRTSDGVTEPIDRTFDHFDRTARCPTTTHLDQPQRPADGLPPSATTDRASNDPEQNDLSGGGPARASPAPAKCDHGLPVQRRPDGQPALSAAAPTPLEPRHARPDELHRRRRT